MTKSLSAHTQRSTEESWHLEEPLQPSQRNRALPCLLSVLSQDSHEPFGPRLTPTMMGQQERLSGSSQRLMGISTCQGMGSIMVCEERSFFDYTRYYGMFRGGKRKGRDQRIVHHLIISHVQSWHKWAHCPLTSVATALIHNRADFGFIPFNN